MKVERNENRKESRESSFHVCKNLKIEFSLRKMNSFVWFSFFFHFFIVFTFIIFIFIFVLLVLFVYCNRFYQRISFLGRVQGVYKIDMEIKIKLWKMYFVLKIKQSLTIWRNCLYCGFSLSLCGCKTKISAWNNDILLYMIDTMPMRWFNCIIIFLIGLFCLY